MHHDEEIRVIAVDFGNVICRYDYRIFCKRLGDRIGRTSEEVFTALFTDDLEARFESGLLTGPAYHQEVQTRLGAELPYGEFFPMCGDIFSEIPGTFELLERLHARYPLVLLSDTNEIHFGYVRQTVKALQLFTDYVVSYEVGAMKPDPRIYRAVLRRAAVPASACVFFDDRLPNVEGARRVGMHAFEFRSPAQCAAALRDLGVQIP